MFLQNFDRPSHGAAGAPRSLRGCRPKTGTGCHTRFRNPGTSTAFASGNSGIAPGCAGRIPVPRHTPLHSPGLSSGRTIVAPRPPSFRWRVSCPGDMPRHQSEMPHHRQSLARHRLDHPRTRRAINRAGAQFDRIGIRSGSPPGDAIPWGVAAEESCWAPRTRASEGAPVPPGIKLQLIRSTLADSAAAASPATSYGHTGTRRPLSC